MTGLFETMRVVEGRVPLLGRHLARLMASAAELGLDCPGRLRLADSVDAATTGHGTARARLSLTPAGAAVEVSALPETAAVRVVSVVVRPGPERVHKLTDRARYDAALGRARTGGGDHALLVSPDGAVLEADHANVVVATGGRLVTPPARGVLPGIARGLLVEAGVIEEAPLTRADLDSAAAIVLTNALRGVVRVASLDGRPRREVTSSISHLDEVLRSAFGGD